MPRLSPAIPLLLATAAFLADSPAQSAPPTQGPITIRVVDEREQPLAAGTAVEASVWSFPDPAARDRFLPSGLGPRFGGMQSRSERDVDGDRVLELPAERR